MIVRWIEAVRAPEYQLGDFLFPWGMGISAAGFLLAWFVALFLERRAWTRHIWNFPLFFVALCVLFGCALGLLFAP